MPGIGYGRPLRGGLGSIHRIAQLELALKGDGQDRNGTAFLSITDTDMCDRRFAFVFFPASITVETLPCETVP
jgi:hypothetical protein